MFKMGFFSTLGWGILGTAIISKFVKNSVEEKKRKMMICEFDDIVTEEVFENIVYNCAKRIRRIERTRHRQWGN